MNLSLKVVKKPLKKSVKKSTAEQDNALIPQRKLRHWIKHNQNVLFEGKHGVGKTSIILDAWQKAGLKYAYFSGATMDPFIDFVGVPVKVINSKTGESSIELIRPKHLPRDVQALFFDEFNRTHKKVRNAVMELLQFKTINGKPISKDLRMIWAAVNPDNEQGDNDYDTDRLDPAQRDRFQVHQSIPYLCDLSYFTKKFGEEVARKAIQYWNQLPDEARDRVSPRRLDYALEAWKRGGDVRDVLPLEANPGQLSKMLEHKGTTLDGLVKKQDPDEYEKFWKDENNYNLFHAEMLNTQRYHVFIPWLPKEKIAVLLSGKQTGPRMRAAMHSLYRKMKSVRQVFNPILESIVNAGQGSSFTIKWCNRMLRRFKLPKPKPVSPVPGSMVAPKGLGLIPSFIRELMNQTHTADSLRAKFSNREFTTLREKKVERWCKRHGYKFSRVVGNNGETEYSIGVRP